MRVPEKFFGGAIILWFLLVLTINVAIAYTIVHFIIKWW